MPKFKLIISDPEEGKTRILEVEDSRAQSLIGKKLGEILDGSIAGLADSQLQITGGSDQDGNPMKLNVHGGVRTSIMLSSGPGYRPKKRGERRRKIVRGDTITDSVIQINMKIFRKKENS